ncbi:GTPase-activating protein [Starmerella bacillaris]|uniref:GTPase-activating protein n=1 Tax=Starmerella bacillaris TaxID=1247836 RepID=A0AAV5RE95_STABA|nr:GTPase-activating protein [Starmerella bacillaris]
MSSEETQTSTGTNLLSSWWRSFKNSNQNEPHPAPTDRPNLMRASASSSAVPRTTSTDNRLFNLRNRSPEPSFHHQMPLQPDPSGSPIFGAPLSTSIQYAGVNISVTNQNGEDVIYGRIPIVVAKCAAFLKHDATEVEGIFRIPGSIKRIRTLQQAFSQPPTFGREQQWDEYTVHDASNLLKRFLATLPDTLIPASMYQKFREPMLGEFKRIADYLNTQAITGPKSTAVSECGESSRTASPSGDNSSQLGSAIGSSLSSPMKSVLTPQVSNSGTTAADSEFSDDNKEQPTALCPQTPSSFHSTVTHFGSVPPTPHVAEGDRRSFQQFDADATLTGSQASSVNDSHSISNSYSNSISNSSLESDFEPPKPYEIVTTSPKTPTSSNSHSQANSINAPVLIKPPPEEMIKECIDIYETLIQALPEDSSNLLVYILDLLSIFSSASDVNKMTASNLAAIFQPSILTIPEHDMDINEYRISQLVIMFLIENSAILLKRIQVQAIDNPKKFKEHNVQIKPAPYTSTTLNVPDHNVFRGRRHSKSLSSAAPPALRLHAPEDDERPAGFRQSIRSFISRDSANPRSRSPDTRRQSWLPKFGSD